MPVLRFRMPDETVTVHDLVRGEVTFPAGARPDFVVARGQRRAAVHAGQPRRRRADADHPRRCGARTCCSSTPRQVALYARAGRARRRPTRVPDFGHLPLVMGEGNRKLSKRDPQSNLLLHRDRGFLPRGDAQLPGAAGLGDRRGPGRVHARRAGRRLRRARRATRTRRGGTRRRPRPSTATTCAALAPADFAGAARCLPARRRRARGRADAGATQRDARGRRAAGADADGSCSARRRRCSASCFVDDADLQVDAGCRGRR